MVKSLQSYWFRVGSKLYYVFRILVTDLKECYGGLNKNPRWLLMRKIGRFTTIRSIAASFSNPPSKSHEAIEDNCSLFNCINVDKVVEYLKKDGCYLGINLPRNIVQEILDFATYTTCYDHGEGKPGFYYLEKEQAQTKHERNFVFGRYYNTALLCPAIRKLESDPKLLEIAAKYLKADPVHQGNNLWWSFARKTTPYEQFQNVHQRTQVFHYDLDDYRFLKFFFYITDVGLSSGPHVYVSGSHEKKKLLHKLLRGPCDEKNLINYYGADSIMTVCGEAGFGFVEDTFGFHKGATPTDRDRLLLVIEFAINDYGKQSDLRKLS
ncbi:phytanoyl-CoA dioxygenase family protein [Nostoc sp.]|uniref:phytanoyl-CoA dioxygenase family protein n=1 Tax=Nostoc sp. TaxID=1180 RepID=UPI003593075E